MEIASNPNKNYKTLTELDIWYFDILIKYIKRRKSWWLYVKLIVKVLSSRKVRDTFQSHVS